MSAADPTTATTTTTTTTAHVPPQALDVAFCCDCTGSMGAYLQSAKDNILLISQKIHDQSQNTDVRFALIKYRDHPPQDSTFVTEVFPFTGKIEVMKRNVFTMEANGGGDGPEAVAAGLHEVDELAWRPNASKVCVLISDAPPHGLGESGDGFPNGSPDGNDPIQTCRSLAAKGVVVYAVGVEPILSTSYKFARDFMMTVAKITDGKFLPLGKADILAEVIVGGALEGSNMDALWAKMEKEVADEAAKTGEKLSDAERISRAEKQLAFKKGSCHQVTVANPYLDERYDHSNVNEMFAATSLSGARAKMSAQLNTHVAKEVQSYDWQQQEAISVPASVSVEQCERMVCRGRKKANLFSYSS